MADERKRSIREHLARSSNDMNFERTPQNYDSSEQSLPDGEKKRIQDHLNRSKGQSGMSNLSDDQRKQRIKEHLRVTKG